MTIDVHVGTDVEAIADVAAAIDRWGRRYTRRLFTEAEHAECGDSAPRLTARFAAKEAAIKVLAPDDVVPRWRSIEVRTSPNGAPSLVLHDEAAELARQRRIGSMSVSLSHGAGVGTATVVALGQGGH
jgi:holo-[acyl-carrier protein] synthase